MEIIEKYVTASATENYGQAIHTTFPASVFLNMLTETEACALFRSSTQIIADTALLMSRRDAEVDVSSTRFDSVMTACVSEDWKKSAREKLLVRGVQRPTLVFR